MKSLRVTVVPVALRPVADDPLSTQLRVSTLRPGGEWLSTTVTEPATTLDVARRMLDNAMHPEVRAAPHLENAGVEYSSGTPNLLLTAVLPIAAAELNDSAEDWPLLTPWVGDDLAQQRPRLLRLEPVQAAVVAYWRGQMVRSTAALDFLPRYFTMHQARSVYASVWGEAQQDGNFQRWLSSAKDADGFRVCGWVPDEDVRHDTQTEFAQGLTAATAGVSATMVKQQWDPKIIGASAAVAGLAGLATLIPAAQVVGAMVGATIGYQRAKNTGRPPRWYRRVAPERIDLATWYPVRPPATSCPPTFVI